MGWFGDLFFIFIIGLINVVVSLYCGFYWLKHEHFPWEKRKLSNEDNKKVI